MMPLQKTKVEIFSMDDGLDDDSDMEAPALPEDLTSVLSMMEPVDAVLSAVWNQLHADVEAMVAPIAHLEKRWPQHELTKRIVRYIYKAISAPMLSTMPWKAACAYAIERALQPLNNACNEADWFFEIDLLPVLTKAVWEVLSRIDSEVTFRQVQEEAYNVYHHVMDEVLLQKGMWQAVEDTFGGQKERSKVFNALARTYQDALQGAKSDVGPPDGNAPDKNRECAMVRAFFKRWLEDSMNRVWNIEYADRLFTPPAVQELFQRLLSPFGEENGFSCVPSELTTLSGPPPPTWGYVATAVQELFKKWDMVFRGSGPKRGRRAIPY
mmetsp:Transcript_25452/g.58652  ORF Transcript_25452/g.58652 Transcript_25452/m.58652 type:complete len:325 (+) Transcript_25452:150-1124(+)